LEARTPFWRGLGDALVRRYAHSYWALLALLGSALVPLTLLFLLRGMRMVQYAVAGAAGAVGLALAFAYPYYALLASLFIAYSGLDRSLPGPVAWGLLAVATGRVLYDWFSGQQLEWGSRNFRVSTALFLAIVLTSLLFAYDIGDSLVHLTQLGIGLGIFVAVSGLCTNPRRVQQLLLVFAAGFTLQVTRYFMELVSAFGAAIVLQPTGKRLAEGDANQTAVIASCLLVPLVQMMERLSIGKRLLIAPLVVINVVAVILSTSRIGMILLVLAGLYLLLRSRHRALYSLLVAIALVVFFVNVPTRYWTRFVALGQLSDMVVDRSLLLRMHAQEVGWTIFMDHFWTGVGIGNFGTWSQRYMSIDLWAHNSLLDVAATLGIFGFVIYVFWLGSGVQMLAAAARRVRRARSKLGWGVSLDLAGVLALHTWARSTELENGAAGVTSSE
jgi:O-antigen ligase